MHKVTELERTEKIQYFFSMEDIKEALMAYYNITIDPPDDDEESQDAFVFLGGDDDDDYDYDDITGVKLEVMYRKPKRGPKIPSKACAPPGNNLKKKSSLDRRY
jgi:hypothetical protein